MQLVRQTSHSSAHAQRFWSTSRPGSKDSRFPQSLRDEGMLVKETNNDAGVKEALECNPRYRHPKRQQQLVTARRNSYIRTKAHSYLAHLKKRCLDLAPLTLPSTSPVECCTSLYATASVLSSCLVTRDRCGEVALTRLLCIPRGMVRWHPRLKQSETQIVAFAREGGYIADSCL